MNKITSFTDDVSKHLKTYVYRLIDPRNGETFYIGKGKGNRIFHHVKEELQGDDSSYKIKRIREIKLFGLEVAHVIHRHGMNDETALAVEAALIDAYPSATNISAGTGSFDYGTMHVNEIVAQYAADEAEIKHKAILININRTATERSIYNATRYAWRINKKIAMQAQVILANRLGIIVGAFVATNWLDATPENFPEMDPMPGRKGFIGEEASLAIQNFYIGKRVPDIYRKRGAIGPVKYSWSKVYARKISDS